jgi:hypothetical protein
MRDIDLLADLPPPDDFEPSSLRDDIRDELQDHLQCAFRREVLRDGDEPAAQARVLNRFGDPKQIARRLWWQAMWSRVMGKKLLAGLQWAVTLAAVFCAGAVYVTNARILGELESARTEDQRSTASLAHEIQELRQQIAVAQDQADRTPTDRQPGANDGRPDAPGGSGAFAAPLESAASKTSLKVALVFDREGRPPVTDPVKEIALVGGAKRYVGLPWIADSGQYVFTAPGGERYGLTITLADGQTSTRTVLIRDEQPREMTVVCPEPRTNVAVTITASPLPEDLQDVFGVSILMEQQHSVVENMEWRSPRAHDQAVVFDDGGKVTGLTLLNPAPMIGFAPGGAKGYEVVGPYLDLGAASDDDRRVVLMTGPVDVRWIASVAGEEYTEAANRWPRTESFRRTVTPGEDHWELDVPEELIADMRRMLAARKSAGD